MLPILVGFVLWLLATNKWQDWAALFKKNTSTSSSGSGTTSNNTTGGIIPGALTSVLPDLSSIL